MKKRKLIAKFGHNHRHIEHIMEKDCKLLENLGIDFKTKWKNNQCIETDNAIIRYLSIGTNIDRLRGFRFDLIYLDEVRYVKTDTINELYMLAEVSGCKVVYI